MDSIGLSEILIIFVICGVCIVIPLVVFFVVRFVIQKGKKIAKNTPDQLQRTMMRGLEMLDERLPNDPREADRWSSGNDELDLGANQTHSAVSDYEPFEVPEESPAAADAPAQAYCSGCGAPLKHGSKKCEYCGQSS